MRGEKQVTKPRLRDLVKVFVNELRYQYRQEIRQDARAFKLELIALIRAEMPPFPGRPDDPAITTAEQLRAEGLTFDQVARRSFPVTSGSTDTGNNAVAPSCG
jgi:hypothetical protein